MTHYSKIDASKGLLDTFGKREDGAVAMVFALATFPFCMAVALAVDYSRSVHMNQKFSAAIDTATVAAAKAVRDGVASDADVKAHAFAMFKENIKGHYATFDPANFNVTIDRANSRVDIKLPVAVPTTFARIGGFETMKINQAATAVFQLRDIEVGLALDVTGSMLRPTADGKIKITALKSAFSKFTDLMIPATPVSGQTVRLGLAPYAASVNLGRFASVASGGASGDGCVVERAAPHTKYTDDAPGGLDVFSIAVPGQRDIDTTNAGEYRCIAPVVTPLTSDRDELVRQVNAYAPESRWTTAGHMGAHWAWNLVSPEWAGVWGAGSEPVAYSNRKTVKAVILMTDGEFNTAFYNASSAAQALELCKGMKAKGIQVFTMGFGLGGNATALATLQQCATPGDDYFVDAANEADLDAAFAKFAGKINALRLAQ